MERRGEERVELGMPNSMGYSSSGPPLMSMIQQESPVVKLPLAPTILSTPSDRRIRSPNTLIHPPRRGSSIFNPSQTLIPPPHPPPPPQRQEPSPDPDPPPSSAPSSASEDTPSIKYRECLKNHAASMGTHVVDGCGEFMPSGDTGTPASFRCAACHCHRNFHRKELDGNPASHNHNPNPNPGQLITFSSMPPHLQHRHKHTAAAPSITNLRATGSGGESSSEELNMFQSKKRFRTKFRQDQKEKMQELASKLGWRIQKQDEQEVHQLCTEVGVNRKVFKVWMHNNKQAMMKKTRTKSDSH